MSLKAKLEAVIYAAEEPVTLAQLAGLFAEEVLPGLDEAALQEPPRLAPRLVEAGEGEPGELSPDADSAPAPEETPGEETLETEAAVGGEGDEKKAARLRDRRVRQALQSVLDELIADYANSERGMEIREIAGGYRTGFGDRTGLAFRGRGGQFLLLQFLLLRGGFLGGFGGFRCRHR